VAINPLNPNHRDLLSKSVDYSFQELKRYGKMRDNTIRAYLGANPGLAEWDWTQQNTKYRQSLPKGNLLQTAGLSLQVALAFGEPQFLVKARVPQHAGLAMKLGAALNRMANLLNLGETHRMVAADSFFGYGIYKCGVGKLPLSARYATGLEIGPCVWRVSQDDFIYDITASNWDEVAYVGDLYTCPLEEAQAYYPEHADRLFTMTDSDRMDSPHVLARPSRFYSPQKEIWLLDVYFPGTAVIATWPVRNESFGELVNEPLGVREYEGHWSGIYQVLSHLYSPDELVPIAQAESVKSLHFAFNDVLHLLVEQARNAKKNPMYQTGSDKDMMKLWQALDRRPVGVNNPGQLGGLFEIPGPSPDQAQFLASLKGLFDQFIPTMDEPLRAPTATQGTLERQTTNAVVSEARRKDIRALQLVGYKLGHLLMNDNELILPASQPLRPGSKIEVDVTWKPAGLEPRVAQIDDFEISIDPYALPIRTPEQRLSQLFATMNGLQAFIQMKTMMGAPINIEELLNIAAEYSGLPELKDIYEEMDPMHQMQRGNSRMSVPRMGVGQYTRTNVSEKTKAGALEESLNMVGSDSGQTRFE
jgi:hypothetical protein